VLDELEHADVHFSVALRALVESLPAGHIIAATRSEASSKRSYRSVGTLISAPTWDEPLDEHRWNSLSEDSAIGRIGGRRVYWWQLAASDTLVRVDDGTSAKLMRRQIFESLEREGAPLP
ncbi:hypothetical protein GS528_16995, partial [Rhodococcus hoagii]|nr:hypothetical protein [Prescottella equi]